MFIKLTRTILCCVAGALLTGGVRNVAAQAIPAPLLNDLKAATVFVKVNRRTLDWSGSGFVIQKLKGSALVVTNAHVLEPPKIDDADIAKNVPKETMKLVFELQKEVSGVPSTAQVVFYSGTPQELLLPAEVVATDTAHDLAVLKVAGVPDTVKPMRPNLQKIPETTPLIGLGFPFGGMLAQRKTNPTITVTRVELSSYKPISDDMTLLQLQGPLNPGNSGGPVVDVHGKLCGVQVLTIYGSGLGFAIPTEQVTRMMQGRLTTWRMSAKKGASDEYDVEYRVQLIDPMHKISNLDLHYLTGAAAVPSSAEFSASPTPLSGAQSIDLKRDGQWAVGSFKMAVSGSGPLVVTVQPSWTDGSKKHRLGQPEVVRIRGSADAPAGPDDGRTFWHYVDKKKGEGWFIKTATGWDEEDDGASHHFVEVARTPDVIDLLDKKRGIGVHLHHDKLAFKFVKKKTWIVLYSGAWEATGTVTSPK